MMEEVAERIKKGIAIITTTGIIFSFVGCGNINKGIKTNGIVSTSDESIESVLDEVSPYTELDNNMPMLNYEGISFIQIMDNYDSARANEDYVTCQKDLYQLGYLILQEAIVEVLDIDIKNITSFGITWDEYDNYKVLIKYIEDNDYMLEKEFYLSGDGIEMAEVLKRCMVSNYTSIDEIDSDYQRCVNFLLTSGYIVNETIVFSYNGEKTKTFIK